MSKTTIEVTEAIRDDLQAERKPHESNYSQTIARLLDSDDGGQLWTESEIRDLARDEIHDTVSRSGGPR